jgi:hypothetical protein
MFADTTTGDLATVVYKDEENTVLDINKDAIDKIITESVRTSQLNKVEIDYNGVLNTFLKIYGRSDDLDRLAELFSNLINTNPYK